MSVRFVEEIREMKGMTHAEFARAVGVTLQTVRVWCGLTRKDRPPTGMDLATLCRLQVLSGWSEREFMRRLKAEFLNT